SALAAEKSTQRLVTKTRWRTAAVRSARLNRALRLCRASCCRLSFLRSWPWHLTREPSSRLAAAPAAEVAADQSPPVAVAEQAEPEEAEEAEALAEARCRRRRRHHHHLLLHLPWRSPKARRGARRCHWTRRST